MVIEEYVEFGVPLIDIALQYSELLVVGLAGAGISALFKN